MLPNKDQSLSCQIGWISLNFLTVSQECMYLHVFTQIHTDTYRYIQIHTDTYRYMQTLIHAWELHGSQAREECKGGSRQRPASHSHSVHWGHWHWILLDSATHCQAGRVARCTFAVGWLRSIFGTRAKTRNLWPVALILSLHFCPNSPLISTDPEFPPVGFPLINYHDFIYRAVSEYYQSFESSIMFFCRLSTV